MGTYVASNAASIRKQARYAARAEVERTARIAKHREQYLASVVGRADAIPVAAARDAWASAHHNWLRARADLTEALSGQGAGGLSHVALAKFTGERHAIRLALADLVGATDHAALTDAMRRRGLPLT